MIINGKEIKIDRSKVRVSEMDKAYCELVNEILKNGIKTENRTGIDTLSIAGWNYKFNVGREFPIAAIILTLSITKSSYHLFYHN